MLIDIVIAILIIVLGVIFGRIIGNLVRRILKEFNVDKILKDQANVKIPVEDFLGSFVSYILYFAAIIMALNKLGLTTGVLNAILIVLLVIVVILIILAFKDFVPNVVAGFFIYQTGKIKKGDDIEINNVRGLVVKVELAETTIKTKSDDLIIIPNSVINKSTLVKFNNKKK